MKQQEINKSGFMFWGYGGYDLQPKKVQEFLQLAKSENQKVQVYFCQTKTFIKLGYKNKALGVYNNQSENTRNVYIPYTAELVDCVYSKM